MQSRFRELMMPVLRIYATIGMYRMTGLRSSWASASPRGKFALLLGLPLALAFCLQLRRDRDVFRVALDW